MSLIVSSSPQAEHGTANRQGLAPAMLLCSAATLDALEEWFAGAAPGHRAEYARGFVPPRETATWKRAGDLARSGAATLTTARDESNPGVTIYMIVKCEGGDEQAAPKARPLDLARLQKASLMKRLVRCAERGQATPTYADLAAHLALPAGAKSKRRVRHLLEAMEAAGRITIHAGDATRGPAITIRGTGRARGKSTRRVTR